MYPKWRKKRPDGRLDPVPTNENGQAFMPLSMSKPIQWRMTTPQSSVIRVYNIVLMDRQARFFTLILGGGVRDLSAG